MFNGIFSEMLSQMFGEMASVNLYFADLYFADLYIVAIVTLFPLTAALLVSQVNPYQALIIRGILGAIAALVYVLFGAADVALTEALVGTMLSITLYAVAVRSSMSMRLGILESMNLDLQQKRQITDAAEVHETIEDSVNAVTVLDPINPKDSKDSIDPFASYRPLLHHLHTCLKGYHLRLEITSYATLEDLETALKTQAVQSICIPSSDGTDLTTSNPETSYQIETRLWRLYEILQEGLPPTIATLTYQNPHPLEIAET